MTKNTFNKYKLAWSEKIVYDGEYKHPSRIDIQLFAPRAGETTASEDAEFTAAFASYLRRNRFAILEAIENELTNPKPLSWEEIIKMPLETEIKILGSAGIRKFVGLRAGTGVKEIHVEWVDGTPIYRQTYDFNVHKFYLAGE